MSVTGEVRQPRMAIPRMPMTSSARSGMTLAELLVAMLVLLVGIYAVAKGFPTLFQQVQADSDRSAMVRLAERVMNIAKASPEDLPEAIYGYATTGAAPSVTYTSIRPDEEPKDPDEPSLVINPANSRDDIINVVGQPLAIPAPFTPVNQATDTVVRAPLPMGPGRTDPNNNDAADVRVYQLIPLVRTDEPPTLANNHTAPGTFYVETRVDNAADHSTLQWHVYLPRQAQFMPNQPLTDVGDATDCVLDYAWVDSATPTGGRYKPQYYVQHETVTHDGLVLPAGSSATLNFAGLVPEECRAWLRVEFAFGDATSTDPGKGYVTTPSPVPAAGTFYLEYNYGATLLFNAADAGRPVYVDYTLRTGSTGSTKDDSRRELMVFETEQTPAVSQGPPYSVKLAIGGLNDTDPLFVDTVDGTNLPSPVHLLMVDLTDGHTYTDADSPATIDNLDYVNSVVTLNATAAASCLGHQCRFYYRTMDQHALQMTKAPATFLPSTVAALYTGAAAASVVYKTYTASTQAIGAGTGLRTILKFPDSSAGQTVSVDYTYGGDPTHNPAILPSRATGELHVIHEESCQIALDNPDVVSIIAVRGVSVKARGWWRALRGKLRHVDVDSCLLRL